MAGCVVRGWSRFDRCDWSSRVVLQEASSAWVGAQPKVSARGRDACGEEGSSEGSTLFVCCVRSIPPTHQPNFNRRRSGPAHRPLMWCEWRKMPKRDTTLHHTMMHFVSKHCSVIALSSCV